MRVLLALGLTAVMSFFVIGCEPSHQEVLNTWVGHHRDDLMRKWGPPTQETRLSNGGSIHSYRRGGGQAFDPVGNMVMGVPISCQRDMETNSAGIIVSWRYEGNC